MLNALVRTAIGFFNGAAEALTDVSSSELAVDAKRALWTRDYMSQPGATHATITPSDSVNFTGGVCRSIYVGTGGDVSIVDSAGTTKVWKNAQSGSTLPIQALRVNVTGTGASDLLALY